MEEEQKKIDYKFISKQLVCVGWELLSGNIGFPGAMWQHHCINRKLSTYEAALCHNLLVKICDINEKHRNFEVFRNMLRLFADGWSIDISNLEEDEVFISVLDLCLWWKQINQGGERFTFQEAETYVEKEKALDCLFLQYLIRLQSGEIERMVIRPIDIVLPDQEHEKNECVVGSGVESESVERIEQPIRTSIGDSGFVFKGDKELLVNALLFLVDKDIKTKMKALNNKVKALIECSREVEEALKDLGISLDEKGD